MSKKILPYSHQYIDEEDVHCVNEVLNSEWLTSGSAGLKFESAFSKKTDSKFSVACSSGTAALHLAALALGLGKKNKVIVPAITFTATANAIRYTGASVVFCDVEKSTGLISLEHVESILKDEGETVNAIFPVHLNGQAPDLEQIHFLADKYNLFVVEDACHAIGGSYIKRNSEKSIIGNCEFSDMTIFSLHPVKTITAGEGGVVNTNNSDLYNKILKLRNHGITKNEDEFQNKEDAYSESGNVNPWYYEQKELGFNYRLSDINSALATSQLKKLNMFKKSRIDLLTLYDTLLAPLAPDIKPIYRNSNTDPCWHLYPVLINFNAIHIGRAELMENLKKEGIMTQVHYIPVYKHPYYKKNSEEILTLPNSEYYYNHVLSLPLFPAMNEDDVKYIVKSIQQILAAQIS